MNDVGRVSVGTKIGPASLKRTLILLLFTRPEGNFIDGFNYWWGFNSYILLSDTVVYNRHHACILGNDSDYC